jgi:hypothetical protein
MSARNDGRIRIHDTTLTVWEEPGGVDAAYEEAFTRDVFKPLRGFMRKRGWVVTRDPEGKKRYKCISKWMWVASFGDLQATLRLSGRSIEILFFQEINRENPNGGRYDFRRFHRMPYTVRLRFLVELRALIDHLQQAHGYHGPTLADVEGSEYARLVRTCAYGRETLPTEDPLRSFNERWDMESDRRRGEHRFRRDETGWPTRDEIGTYHVYHPPGAVRYWINPHGYVLRGRVYTNMNSMYAFVYGTGVRDVTYQSGSEFTATAPRLGKVRNHRGVERITRLLGDCVQREDFEKARILRDYRNRLSRLDACESETHQPAPNPEKASLETSDTGLRHPDPETGR